MPAPRDILLLCGDPGVPLYGPSGASAHLRGVAHALIADGHRVRIAVPALADKRGAVDDLIGAPVTTIDMLSLRLRLRMPGTHRETALARLLVAKAVDEGGLPDLVWERHSLWCDAGARLAERFGIERITELNAPLTVERSRFSTVRDPDKALATERLNLRSATRVLAVSAWLRDWAIEQGVPAKRVRYVPNGSSVRPADPTDALTLGFVGSMKPWHGLQYLPALLDALPQWRLLLAGSGPVPPPEHPRIEAVGRIAPSELHTFLGRVRVGIVPYGDDAPPWYCPLKLVDYLSAGVPAVAADVGDCAHLLASGGGEVVPALGTPEATDAWAAAIERQAAAERAPRPRPWSTVVREALAD